MDNKSDVIILGSGPAGCTAAIYAARANLKPILIHGPQPGGQLTITTDVENYPGFAELIQGPALMDQMIQQAKKVGTRFAEDLIESVNFSSRPFKLKGITGVIYEAGSLIISTGAQAKWLGLESEKKFQGFGVSGCATCDGFFFKQKEVVVIGGGNTAVEEAIYLTNHASKVTLIHRRDSLRAEKIAQDRLFANPKIEVIWDSVAEEIIGEEKPRSVTGIVIKNLKTNQKSTIKADGIFIAIGHKPNTDMFKDSIELDAEGYIITKPGTTFTNIEGVFACGDVQDKIYRQAVTAAGTGCMAALDAERFLSK
ncbi:MAG: thioredoxin-disulfide reductase [Rickettsiaceae bacterium]|nr:thioredoxin-disulfide reductase [Rickettsiaceae bacterium]